MRTSHAILVPVTAERAFSFLSDVTNETRWRQSIIGSRYVDAAQPALGVHGETDVAMGSRELTMRWVITDFVAGHRVAWQLDGDPWFGGGGYTVAPDAAGARIEAALEVRLKGVARLFEPVIGFSLRRGLRADLKRLAALLPSVADH